MKLMKTLILVGLVCMLFTAIAAADDAASSLSSSSSSSSDASTTSSAVSSSAKSSSILSSSAASSSSSVASIASSSVASSVVSSTLATNANRVGCVNTFNVIAAAILLSGIAIIVLVARSLQQGTISAKEVLGWAITLFILLVVYNYLSDICLTLS